MNASVFFADFQAQGLGATGASSLKSAKASAMGQFQTGMDFGALVSSFTQRSTHLTSDFTTGPAVTNTSGHLFKGNTNFTADFQPTDVHKDLSSLEGGLGGETVGLSELQFVQTTPLNQLDVNTAFVVRHGEAVGFDPSLSGQLQTSSAGGQGLWAMSGDITSPLMTGQNGSFAVGAAGNMQNTLQSASNVPVSGEVSASSAQSSAPVSGTAAITFESQLTSSSATPLVVASAGNRVNGVVGTSGQTATTAAQTKTTSPSAQQSAVGQSSTQSSALQATSVSGFAPELSGEAVKLSWFSQPSSSAQTLTPGVMIASAANSGDQKTMSGGMTGSNSQAGSVNAKASSIAALQTATQRSSTPVATPQSPESLLNADVGVLESDADGVPTDKTIYLTADGQVTTQASRAGESTSGANPTQSQAAVQQVIERFVQRFDGKSSKFEIRLDPPELGKVDVRIEVGPDNKVNAVFAARDPAALDALMRGAKTLENALAQAGVDLSEGGLSFEMANSGSEHQAWQDQMDRGNAHASRSLSQGSELVDQTDSLNISPFSGVHTQSRLNLTA